VLVLVGHITKGLLLQVEWYGLSVCLSLCRLVAYRSVSHNCYSFKPAHSIEMPFGMVSGVGPTSFEPKPEPDGVDPSTREGF